MNEFNQSLKWMTKDPFGQDGYAYRQVGTDEMASPFGATASQGMGQGLGQTITSGGGGFGGAPQGPSPGATMGGFNATMGRAGGKENKNINILEKKDHP